jgi:hypothetical protein
VASATSADATNDDMPDKTISKADEDSPSAIRPLFDDPDLLEEWNALADPEDRADYLEALQTVADLDEEELCSWEDVKAELGF